jgi:DNA (cytosine-5)-methyltransferase 1
VRDYRDSQTATLTSKDKCPDGPRYKALGNSMAVPVMKWIGERIKTVDSL